MVTLVFSANILGEMVKSGRKARPETLDPYCKIPTIILY